LSYSHEESPPKKKVHPRRRNGDGVSAMSPRRRRRNRRRRRRRRGLRKCSFPLDVKEGAAKNFKSPTFSPRLAGSNNGTLKPSLLLER